MAEGFAATLTVLPDPSVSKVVEVYGAPLPQGIDAVQVETVAPTWWGVPFGS
jgi:hypothetical protein